MSLQVFLRARLTGIERFLAEATGDLELRIRWTSLIAEVLPRGLLAELGLARILLGSSGGEQFLIVLPAEFRDAAQELLERASRDIAQISHGTLRLVWSTTENLGDWSDIRRRLVDGLTRRLAAPLATGEITWEPYDLGSNGNGAKLFNVASGAAIHDAPSVGWSPEQPATIQAPSGKHTWGIGRGQEDIQVPRHAALDDDGLRPASLPTLARRAAGRKTWGVLRGDVDNFEVRLNRAQTIEEHIQLSILYKQFFVGELEMLCSMPEFFRRITLLGTGGDDFAAYGSWDALIQFARELQRVFSRFVEANLKELAGPEGKTISMALSVAQDPDEPLDAVFRAAGIALETGKASGNDSFHLFGRTLDWKQVGDASETKATMTRMIAEFGCSPQFLYELAGFYRGGAGPELRRGGRGRNDRVERPWRFHRRLNRVIATTAGGSRAKEFQHLRSDLIADFTGRNAAQIRLRPAGRVALEWARLETES